MTKRQLGSCFNITVHFHPPVRRSLDHIGRTPCRPQCNGRPLFVRYWEAEVPGTNPNLLLRTESQHTSVDSNHSSAQHGLHQNLKVLSHFHNDSSLNIHWICNGIIYISSPHTCGGKGTIKLNPST